MVNKMKKICIKEIAVDFICSFGAGLLVAFGLFFFSSANGFVPGGINGFATLLGDCAKISSGYFMIALNLPLFILIAIFIDKKTAIYLTIYVATQSIGLIVLKEIDNFPVFYAKENGNLIFAAIATGVVTGFGFAMQVRRHGASGGTYSISALVKHWKPSANMAWLAFAFDSSVVILVFFINLFTGAEAISDKLNDAIVAALCTLTNLFIANLVVDICLQGDKAGYKFEIVTEEPDKLSEEIMTQLKHGVTELRVNGMYTHQEKFMIVCIIRKRELSRMIKLLKKYPRCFSSFSKVNEIIGNFKK